MTTDPFGTDPHKLYRPTDPETSKAAAESVDTQTNELRVYLIIKEAGAYGCTADDIKAHPTMAMRPYSTATARPAALKQKGLVVETGKQRPGESGSMRNVLVVVSEISVDAALALSKLYQEKRKAKKKPKT